MPLDHGRLTLGPIPSKFDRLYRGGRDGDEMCEVNVARLECSCPEWRAQRATFPPDDARRVCPHLYDKLYATRVEKSFDLLGQLFIRYGRNMWSYQAVEDELGVLLIGQPFGPHSVRAIGVVAGKPVLATYNLPAGDWSNGESDISKELATRILQRMRVAMPEAFAIS